MTSQKLTKKGRVTNHKNPSVRRRLCQDCSFAEFHMTGSQLWLSCKFQKGWRSINSECNLSNEEFMRLSKEIEK